MPEAETHETDTSNPQRHEYPTRKSVLDLFTFVVLTLTMVGVFWYACEAHRTNELTAIGVENETRPLVAVALNPDSFSTFEYSQSEKKRLSLHFTVNNTGKAAHLRAHQ